MKTKWLITIIVPAFILLMSAASNNKEEIIKVVEGPADECYTTNTAFKGGESLTYKAYYSLPPMRVGAGEAKFKVTDEGDNYLYTVDGKTYRSYEWFYKVRDRFESRVSKTDLLPTYALRNIKEGGYLKYDAILFDQEARIATQTIGKTQEVAKVKKYDLSNCMHDVLSVIYATRNQDFSSMNPGDKFPVNIFLDDREYNLKVRYLGKEENVKIPGLGRFNTVVLTPEVIEGEVFKEKDAMKVWATDDANRVPLMIKTPLSVGSVKVVLKDYHNLAHPLSSER